MGRDIRNVIAMGVLVVALGAPGAAVQATEGRTQPVATLAGHGDAAPTTDELTSTPNWQKDTKPSRKELDYTCGEGAWMLSWVEDENGNPVEDSYEASCLTEDEM